jgi:flagellin
MSFRVNTNIAGMNALRNVGQVGAEFSKSITRLSTGLRINSAADDPAGLIVSENFRAQISGIEQAIRNNQDAVNFAKTAEGALDEVNRLLNDARSLAVAAGNTGTLSSTQIQANQSQLNSIVASISRIAQDTQFGTKKLLDGSAGVSAQNTSAANIGSMYFGGNFNGSAVTTNSLVTVSMSTAATRASMTGSVTFATATTTVSAGTFSINGTSFTTSSSMTVTDVVNMINDASSATGVTADFTATQGLTLRSNVFGSKGNFTLSDANGVINAAGTATATGTDAVASVTIDTNGSTAGGLSTITFTGGRGGNNGLTVSDAAGNTIVLTETGNATGAAFTAGNLNVGSSQFQIGANSGQTASLSLGNFGAAQLGANLISGLNLSNVDITTSNGASNALQVIDKAISEVARSRGEIGSFQRNVLDSNIRSLGIAKESLAATESTIRDTDVAEEMTKFTKWQILQQSGMSMLAQANSAPQSVLALLR